MSLLKCREDMPGVGDFLGKACLTQMGLGQFIGYGDHRGVDLAPPPVIHQQRQAQHTVSTETACPGAVPSLPVSSRRALSVGTSFLQARRIKAPQTLATFHPGALNKWLPPL